MSLFAWYVVLRESLKKHIDIEKPSSSEISAFLDATENDNEEDVEN